MWRKSVSLRTEFLAPLVLVFGAVGLGAIGVPAALAQTDPCTSSISPPPGYCIPVAPTQIQPPTSIPIAKPPTPLVPQRPQLPGVSSGGEWKLEVKPSVVPPKLPLTQTPQLQQTPSE